MLDLLLRSQGLLVFGLGLACTIGAFVLRAHILQIVAEQTRGKASADVVAELDQRLDAHEGRLTSMEAALRHLPTADQMHALTVAVTDVRGDIRALNATCNGVEKVVNAMERRLDLIDEHLKRGG